MLLFLSTEIDKCYKTNLTFLQILAKWRVLFLTLQLWNETVSIPSQFQLNWLWYFLILSDTPPVFSRKSSFLHLQQANTNTVSKTHQVKKTNFSQSYSFAEWILRLTWEQNKVKYWKFAEKRPPQNAGQLTKRNNGISKTIQKCWSQIERLVNALRYEENK